MIPILYVWPWPSFEQNIRRGFPLLDSVKNYRENKYIDQNTTHEPLLSRRLGIRLPLFQGMGSRLSQHNPPMHKIDAACLYCKKNMAMKKGRQKNIRFCEMCGLISLKIVTRQCLYLSHSKGSIAQKLWRRKGKKR